MRIFIPGNVPSSKNSKVATSRGVFHSKTVRKYLQSIGVKSYRKKEHENYRNRPNVFEQAVAPMQVNDFPVVMGFHFVRDSRRKFDFSNALQLIADLLVAHGVIEDDCMDYFVPIPLEIEGQWYSIDKDNAGVIIEV